MRNQNFLAMVAVVFFSVWSYIVVTNSSRDLENLSLAAATVASPPVITSVEYFVPDKTSFFTSRLLSSQITINGTNFTKTKNISSTVVTGGNTVIIKKVGGTIEHQIIHRNYSNGQIKFNFPSKLCQGSKNCESIELGAKYEIKVKNKNGISNAKLITLNDKIFVSKATAIWKLLNTDNSQVNYSLDFVYKNSEGVSTLAKVKIKGIVNWNNYNKINGTKITFTTNSIPPGLSIPANFYLLRSIYSKNAILFKSFSITNGTTVISHTDIEARDLIGSTFVGGVRVTFGAEVINTDNQSNPVEIGANPNIEEEDDRTTTDLDTEAGVVNEETNSINTTNNVSGSNGEMLDTNVDSSSGSSATNNNTVTFVGQVYPGSSGTGSNQTTVTTVTVSSGSSSNNDCVGGVKSCRYVSNVSAEDASNNINISWQTNVGATRPVTIQLVKDGVTKTLVSGKVLTSSEYSETGASQVVSGVSDRIGHVSFSKDFIKNKVGSGSYQILIKIVGGDAAKTQYRNNLDQSATIKVETVTSSVNNPVAEQKLRASLLASIFEAIKSIADSFKFWR